MNIQNNYNCNLYNVSGIYRIFNTITKDFYIGSAVRLGIRFRKHLRQLESGKHHSIILQRAYTKYGSNVFRFEIVLICQKQYLIYYEQQLINELNPKYNICKIANSVLGYKWTDEQREKARKRQIGNKNRVGKKHSLSSRMKISKNHANVKKDNNPWFGKTPSKETRDKMRNAKLGKKLSEITKEKMLIKRRKPIIVNNIYYDSIKTASKKLGISTSTLCRWAKQNKNNCKYTNGVN